MKRLWVILLFLLLGAIVNVAVAWGFQIWGDQNVPDPPNVPGHEGTIEAAYISSWARASGSGWPELPEIVWIKDSTGSRFISLIATTGPVADSLELSHAEWVVQRSKQSNYSVEVVQRGWPARTLAMERWFEFHFPTPFQWYCNGFSIAGRFIPIRPLWPGFVVNVIFYAIPLWLLSRLPMVLRRMLRRWRGLCENCAYDFRGTDHDACPECGTEMTNP